MLIEDQEGSDLHNEVSSKAALQILVLERTIEELLKTPVVFRKSTLESSQVQTYGNRYKPLVPRKRAQSNGTNGINGYCKISPSEDLKSDDVHESMAEINEPEAPVVLYPLELVKFEWSQIRPSPAGLYNLGNTCFLNSVLQSLMHIPPLVEYFLSRDHSDTCESHNCMICLFSDHTRMAYTAFNGRSKPFQPKLIVGRLKSIAVPIQLICDVLCILAIAKQFRLGRQEDAHEFLLHVLDSLQNAAINFSRFGYFHNCYY